MKPRLPLCALILVPLAPHAAAQIINNFRFGLRRQRRPGLVSAPRSSTAPGVSSISYGTWEHTGANGLVCGLGAMVYIRRRRMT